MAESMPPQIQTEENTDARNCAWIVSFSATMVPFLGFCYSHKRGVTVRILERLGKTRGGIYGIFALPFLTLAMEKSVYDTVQSIQGISPHDVPDDRGGFPSGGANLPSFSLVAVQKTNIIQDFIESNFMKQKQLVRKLTQKEAPHNNR